MIYPDADFYLQYGALTRGLLDRGAWCAYTHRGVPFGGYLAVCVRAVCVARQKYAAQHIFFFIFFLPFDEFGTIFVPTYIADTTIRDVPLRWSLLQWKWVSRPLGRFLFYPLKLLTL